MRLSLGSVGVLTAGLLIAFAFWPENRAARGPERVVAQEKPGAAAPALQQTPVPKASTLLGSPGEQARPAPLPVVKVCRPVTKEVTDYLAFQGPVQPSQLVQIQSQATGRLRKIDFRPGQIVKSGDLLFEIDPSIYQGELDKAIAERARSDAKLEYARTQFQRMQHNFKGNAVSPEELDRATSERRVAEADDQVAGANLELAKVRLSHTRIVAPINGYISRSPFDVGSLVKAEESALATIVCLDPVYVSIPMDDATWFALRKRIQRGEFPNSEVPVEVFVTGDLKRKGFLEFIEDAAFNSGTTTMRVRVPNSDAALLSGLFVTVRYEVGKPHPALLVPAGALQHSDREPETTYVWVVNNDNVLQRRDVKLTGSPHEGALFEITQGLKPDEWVVCNLAHARQVADGMRIEPKRVP